MAESDQARDLVVDCMQTLEDHFAAQPDVYVSGKLRLYYDKADSERYVMPSMLFARGIEKKRRFGYWIWKEGKAPDVLFEFLAPRILTTELVKKSLLYARLGLREYYAFDWTGALFDPRLCGFWVDQEEYRPLAPDERGRLQSQILGLELGVEGKWLRFYDLATGQRLRTLREKVQEAEGRAQEEAALRQMAEQRLVQLEEELRQLRAGGRA